MKTNYIPKDKDTQLSVPFMRLMYQKKRNKIEVASVVNSLIPEVLYLAIAILSYVKWGHINNVFGAIVFGLWLIILLFIFTLALVNARTMLFPDVIIRPFTYTVVVYQLASALLAHNGSVLWGAVLGGVILGGVPWVIYQLSSGKWIGGGDVKFGFAAGLFLGWKFSFVCLVLVVIFMLSSIAFETIIAKLSKYNAPTRILTGFIWASAILTSFVISLIM